MMEYVWVWQKRSKKRVLFSHWKVVICKIKICKKIYGVFLNKLKLSTTFCLEENFSTPVHIIKYIHTSTLRDMEQLLGSRCCKWPGKSTIESKSTNFKPEYTKFRNVQCKNPRWRFFFWSKLCPWFYAIFYGNVLGYFRFWLYFTFSPKKNNKNKTQKPRNWHNRDFFASVASLLSLEASRYEESIGIFDNRRTIGEFSLHWKLSKTAVIQEKTKRLLRRTVPNYLSLFSGVKLKIQRKNLAWWDI